MNPTASKQLTREVQFSEFVARCLGRTVVNNFMDRQQRMAAVRVALRPIAGELVPRSSMTWSAAFAGVYDTPLQLDSFRPEKGASDLINQTSQGTTR